MFFLGILFRWMRGDRGFCFILLCVVRRVFVCGVLLYWEKRFVWVCSCKFIYFIGGDIYKEGK